MKTVLLTFLALIVAFPAFAAEAWLKPAEAQYVCMMNDKLFDKPQIPIEIDGKTYYGCCAMCADTLKKSPEARRGTDPVSGRPVDKASAVIGAGPDGTTYYFENDANFKTFADGPASQAHKELDGMKMDGN